MEVLILDEDGNAVPVRTSRERSTSITLAASFFCVPQLHRRRRLRRHGPEGAFTVGDVGYVDDDGFLYISGRKADVIVSSGVNVYPAEIEDVLTTLPEVTEVAVVGGPDDRRGERPVTFVHFVDGLDPKTALASVEAAAGGRLAGYKRPANGTFARQPTRDGTGKLLRHVLRGELWEGREDVFANVAPPS